MSDHHGQNSRTRFISTFFSSLGIRRARNTQNNVSNDEQTTPGEQNAAEVNQNENNNGDNVAQAAQTTATDALGNENNDDLPDLEPVEDAEVQSDREHDVNGRSNSDVESLDSPTISAAQLTPDTNWSEDERRAAIEGMGRVFRAMPRRATNDDRSVFTEDGMPPLQDVSESEDEGDNDNHDDNDGEAGEDSEDVELRDGFNHFSFGPSSTRTTRRTTVEDADEEDDRLGGSEASPRSLFDALLNGRVDAVRQMLQTMHPDTEHEADHHHHIHVGAGQDVDDTVFGGIGPLEAFLQHLEAGNTTPPLIFGPSHHHKPQKDDPARARQILEKFEEVEEGLVRRLERANKALGEEEGNSCAVCFEGLSDGEELGWGSKSDSSHERPQNAAQSPKMKVISLPCAHIFHASCLIPWFARPRQTTCPVCRFDIDLEEKIWGRREFLSMPMDFTAFVDEMTSNMPNAATLNFNAFASDPASPFVRISTTGAPPGSTATGNARTTTRDENTQDMSEVERFRSLLSSISVTPEMFRTRSPTSGPNTTSPGNSTQPFHTTQNPAGRFTVISGVANSFEEFMRQVGGGAVEVNVSEGHPEATPNLADLLNPIHVTLRTPTTSSQQDAPTATSPLSAPMTFNQFIQSWTGNSGTQRPAPPSAPPQVPVPPAAQGPQTPTSSLPPASGSQPANAQSAQSSAAGMSYDQFLSTWNGENSTALPPLPPIAPAPPPVPRRAERLPRQTFRFRPPPSPSAPTSTMPSPPPSTTVDLLNWSPPAAPGSSLRSIVEKKEREAGLRCWDMSCGVAPEDDDPLVEVNPRQVHLRKAGTADKQCPHTFHPSCIVTTSRIANSAWANDEEEVKGDEVTVACPVCRIEGVMSKEIWQEGVAGC